MATLIVLALIVSVIGVVVGVFFKISFAIRREDRAGTLRWDAPDWSTQSARDLVGYRRRS